MSDGINPTPFDLAKHTDHHVDMQESSATIWFITIEGTKVRAFDYSTGDGEGDYVLYCHDCMVDGPLPDDAELDFI